MNRDNNIGKKKTTLRSNGNNRKNGRTSRYQPQKDRRPITEDERLLHRPTRQLVSPTEPIPQEQVKEEEHSLDRALHSVAIFGSARTKPEDPT